MTEQPTYYAIIPATVRYDNRLKDRQKLLYGEITCLSQSTGECFASNSYFSELYGVNTDTISEDISCLVKYGYIDRKIYYKEGTKEIEKRTLKLNLDLPPEKDIPYRPERRYPTAQKGEDNNINNNNTRNNITSNYTVSSTAKAAPEDMDTLLSTIEDKQVVQETDGKKKSLEIQSIFAYIKTLETVLQEPLKNWYAEVGKGNTSLKQLKIKVEDIKKKCGGNLTDVAEAINYSYMNGYKAFVQSNKTNSNKKTGPIQDFISCEKSSPEKEHYSGIIF